MSEKENGILARLDASVEIGFFHCESDTPIPQVRML